MASLIATVGVGTLISGATAIFSALNQMQASRAAQAQFQAQAQMAEIQGRSESLRARQEAVQYKEAGTQHLVNVRRNLATINARAAAGSLDPFTGSIGTLMDVNLAQGYQDYATQVDNALIAAENARIAEAGGRFQARIYRAAGRTAAQGGMFQAASGLGTTGLQLWEAGAYRPATGGQPTTARTGGPY